MAVTMRTVETSASAEARDAISHDWIRLLESRGATPILVPNTLADPVAFVRESGCEALLLSNGENAWPPATPELPRDATEHRLIDFAITRMMPVLGVCRGMQMLNIYFGGLVIHDLSADQPRYGQHVATEHWVEPCGGLTALAGTKPLRVNSFHNQGVAVDGLGKGLRPAATAGRELVEALRHEALPIWGIQWHPERSSPSAEADRRLLQHWLQTAQERGR